MCVFCWEQNKWVCNLFCRGISSWKMGFSPMRRVPLTYVILFIVSSTFFCLVFAFCRRRSCSHFLIFIIRWPWLCAGGPNNKNNNLCLKCTRYIYSASSRSQHTLFILCYSDQTVIIIQSHSSILLTCFTSSLEPISTSLRIPHPNYWSHSQRPSFDHAGLTCYTLLSPSITFSLFHSKLKTYRFRKSYPPP